MSLSHWDWRVSGCCLEGLESRNCLAGLRDVCVCVTLGVIGILSDCFSFTVVFLVQQGDWSRFAYPVQRSYGISADEWSDQPLVPASNTMTPMVRPPLLVASMVVLHGTLPKTGFLQPLSAAALCRQVNTLLNISIALATSPCVSHIHFTVGSDTG